MSAVENDENQLASDAKNTPKVWRKMLVCARFLPLKHTQIRLRWSANIGCFFGSMNVKWMSVVLLSTAVFAQTIRPSNIVTTDPTQTNIFVSKVSAPNVNSARVVDGITYKTVQAAINAVPATGG
jgi:hypothetical protein